MYCASGSVRMPVIRWRVVWGLRDVMLTRAPISALSNVDLPTDGRPTIATCPQRCAIAVSAMRLGVDRALCGVLLGDAPARSRSGRDDAEAGNPAFDGKPLRVRIAARRDDRVLGHRQPARLQPFLQARLGILSEHRGVGVAQQIAIRRVDRAARGLVSAVEKN